MSSPLPRLILIWGLAFLFFPASVASVAFAQSNDAAADQAAAKAQPKRRYWTTDWSFQDIDVEKLFSRLEAIGLDIPFDGEGDVSTEFEVGVPWTSLRDAKAYRFNGTLSSQRLRLEHLLLEDFVAEVQYENGLLRLSRLSGRWIDLRGTSVAASREGSFEGEATLQLVPRGDLEIDLRTKTLPLGPLHDLVVSATQQAGVKPVVGTVSGTVQFQAPLNEVNQVTRWTASADLQIENFRMGETVPLSVDTGPVQIRDGVVLAEAIQVTSPAAAEIRLDLAAQVELSEQQRFQFRVRGNDVPLNAFSEIVIPGEQVAAGKLDIDASGRGELATRSWTVSGRLASPSLTVLSQNLGRLEHEFEFDQQRFDFRAIDPDAAAELDAMLLKTISADYQLDEDAVRISELQASIFSGTIAGSATLARKQTLKHQVSLTWRDLKPVVRAELFPPVNAKITVTSSGQIEWSVPAGQIDRPAAHRGTASFDADEISIADAGVGDLSVELRADQGMFQLAGQGQLFGGNFQVQTLADAQPDESWQSFLSRPPNLRVEADFMKLDRIVRVIQPSAPQRWRGVVGAQAQLTSDDAASNGAYEPQVTLSFYDLAIDGQRLARSLTTRLLLRGDVVIIDRTRGSFAGGRLVADGQWSVGPDKQGQLRVRVSDVDASDALMPISLQASQAAAGRVSGAVTISNGDTLRIRGAVTARESSFFAVPTGRINSGLVGTVSADLRRWQLQLPSIEGELAGGRIHGEAKLSSSSIRRTAFDLSSQWTAKKVDFGQLLADIGASSGYAHGNVTGTLVVGGRGIRGVKDLAGSFEANLDATQAGAIPGLLKADQFLGVITLAGVQFDQGYTKGLIRNGAANVSEFWLRSDRVRVWADGLVRLQGPRMDLDVVLSTGNFAIGESQLLAFAAQLAVQSVLPVAALVEINRLVSNRTIHFDLYGPLSDPRIRLKPLETIREEAARFLLRELLVAASTANNSLFND